MKTINLSTILTIMLFFICTSFYTKNNQADESTSRIEYKSQFMKKVNDSQCIVKDTICMTNLYDNLADTLNYLAQASFSTNKNDALLMTVKANDEKNTSEKINTETKPRKLAFVLIDVLKKMLSLMLNQ